MHRTPYLLILTVIVAVAASGFRQRSQPAVQARSEDVLPLTPGKEIPFKGSMSCASSACHGGTGAPASKGSEFSTWASLDRHASAYNALLSDRSRTMLRNFRGGDTADVHPEREALCLRCHSMGLATGMHDCLPDEGAPRDNGPAVPEGVGCEACHGPAEKWLTRHYRRGWKELRDASKEALGFRPTKDLACRVRMCADCHIGSPEAQVNHDLIAAGHPRLNFETASYLAVMPPHWDRARERTRHADLEARTWFLGQLTSAQKALELLGHRAGNAKQPWPEFAEYDCYACHRPLKAQAAAAARAGKIPGSWTWSSWYVAMLGHAAPDDDGWQDVQSLRDEMNKPMPNRDQVRKLALAISTRLNSMSLPDPLDQEVMAKRFEAVARERRLGDNTWDGLTQRYLALAALHQGLTDLESAPRDSRIRDNLLGIKELLLFPAHQDGPGAAFRPNDIEKRLKALHPLLNEK